MRILFERDDGPKIIAKRLNVSFNLLLYIRNTFFVHASDGFFLNLVPVHFALKRRKEQR